MKRKTMFIFFGLLAIAALALAACQPAPAETVVETVIVTEIVEQAGEQVVVTQIVEVTPEPEAMEPVEFMSSDPTTLVYTSFGEPGSFDPGWNYESAGNSVLMNTYETLVFYNRQDANDLIPSLAKSWEISDDGLVYTFNLQEGVTFHNGDVMTAEDVAYSFQRGLLQGGGFSPQALFVEPFFGIGLLDITELVDPSGALIDDPVALQAADPAALLAACEAVTGAIVADVDANTVTMTLEQPWSPFLSTLAGAWGSIQDKAWAIDERGAWDGDCATWQNHYGVDDATAPLNTAINGTGPFMLESWTPGEGWVLVANPNYWRTCDVGPLWEGGPCGPPALERIVFESVTEWGTRFAMVQAGDADFVQVPPQNVSQIDPLVGERCDYDPSTLDFNCAVVEENPNGPLRLFIGHPQTARTDAMFVFDINTEGGNPFLGSGQLDGNGIPPDFFQDVHVRRAFNYCFDWDTYIQEALVGEAVQNYGIIIPGMLGYNDEGSHYSYDLEQCQAELEQAWDGAVAESGFRVQIAYNSGNVTRQTIAQILQSSFGQIDPKYTIETVGLPWPSFLNAIRASRLPVYVSGWGEDIHDPHNWAQPFAVGTYAARQRFPADILAGYKELVDAGVAATDPAERQTIYEELGEYDYEQAVAIRLAVATGRHYEPRWVEGWYYNPIYSTPNHYYYAYSKK